MADYTYASEYFASPAEKYAAYTADEYSDYSYGKVYTYNYKYGAKLSNEGGSLASEIVLYMTLMLTTVAASSSAFRFTTKQRQSA